MIKKLIEIQNQRKLTDKKFADLLCIHRVSWGRIRRTGKIGADTLLEAYRIFPELRGYFFYNDITKDTAETTQDSFLARLGRLLGIR